MIIKENCRFCGEGKKIIAVVYKDSIVDRKVMETEHFYVTVSLGAMVEGHILIIPKEHFLSMGELPNTLMCELEYLMQMLQKVLHDEFQKDIIAFEHGTGNKSDLSAASVVHAHMHLLPVNESVMDYLVAYNCKVKELKKLSSLSSYAEKGESYLFYMDTNNKLYCVENEKLPSQFFRMVVAEKFSLGEWDWHKDNKIFNIVSTVERLRNVEINDELKSEVS